MKKLATLVDTCAPAAVKAASDLTDAQVAEIFLAQGFHDEVWLAAAKKAGLKLKCVTKKKMRLGAFIKKFPEGKYLVTTWNHVFVVDNSKIIDNGWKNDGLCRMVHKAWLVKN